MDNLTRTVAFARKDWGQLFGYAPASKEEIALWNSQVKRRNQRFAREKGLK